MFLPNCTLISEKRTQRFQVIADVMAEKLYYPLFKTAVSHIIAKKKNGPSSSRKKNTFEQYHFHCSNIFMSSDWLPPVWKFDVCVSGWSSTLFNNESKPFFFNFGFRKIAGTCEFFFHWTDHFRDLACTSQIWYLVTKSLLQANIAVCIQSFPSEVRLRPVSSCWFLLASDHRSCTVRPFAFLQ